MSKFHDDGNNSAGAGREAIETWSRSGRRATVEIKGGSMRPFLRDGSVVVVEPVTGVVGAGDIVVFFQGDVLTVHRVVRVVERNGECRFRTKGDGAFNIDPVLIGESDLAGRVVGLKKSGGIVDLEAALHRRGGRLVAALSFCVGTAVAAVKHFSKRLSKDR